MSEQSAKVAGPKFDIEKSADSFRVTDAMTPIGKFHEAFRDLTDKNVLEGVGLAERLLLIYRRINQLTGSIGSIKRDAQGGGNGGPHHRKTKRYSKSELEQRRETRYAAIYQQFTEFGKFFAETCKRAGFKYPSDAAEAILHHQTHNSGIYARLRGEGSIALVQMVLFYEKLKDHMDPQMTFDQFYGMMKKCVVKKKRQ